jgi:diguanylate cyclase (GGDEF)-like protein
MPLYRTERSRETGQHESAISIEATDLSKRNNQQKHQLQWLIAVLLINLVSLGIEFTMEIDLPLALPLRLAFVTPLVLIGFAVHYFSSNELLRGVTSAAPIFALMIDATVMGQMTPEPTASQYMMAAQFLIITTAMSAPLTWRQTVFLVLLTAVSYTGIVLSGLSFQLKLQYLNLVVLAWLVAAGGLQIRWQREVQSAKLARLRQIDAERALQLSQANARLAQLSTTDALTGVANRRVLDELLERWSTSVVPPSPYGVLMVDVDHFKLFNDSQGHAEGDRCLRLVAEALRTALRSPDDILVRYGGEEFAIVLEGASLPETVDVAERLRLAVRRLRIPHSSLGPGKVVTVSVGVAAASDFISPTKAIEQADQLLFAAKKGGRDRVAA